MKSNTYMVKLVCTMVVEGVERLDERIDQRQAERKTDTVRARTGRKRAERARGCCGNAALVERSSHRRGSYYPRDFRETRSLPTKPTSTRWLVEDSSLSLRR